MTPSSLFPVSTSSHEKEEPVDGADLSPECTTKGN